MFEVINMNRHNNDRIKYEMAVIRRRRAEVRKQKIILSGILIAAVLSLSLLAGGHLTFAKGGGNGIKRVKYYRSVMIGCGDTIEAITRNNYSDDWADAGAFIHEVNMINHLDDDEELIAGNYLTIPYYVDIITE